MHTELFIFFSYGVYFKMLFRKYFTQQYSSFFLNIIVADKTYGHCPCAIYTKVTQYLYFPKCLFLTWQYCGLCKTQGYKVPRETSCHFILSDYSSCVWTGWTSCSLHGLATIDIILNMKKSLCSLNVTHAPVTMGRHLVSWDTFWFSLNTI